METRISAVDFVKVRAAMVAQAAASRAAASSRNVQVGADSRDMFDAAGECDAAPLMYHLSYADSHGAESRRIVTVQRIDPDRTGLKLICWCHAAGARRCFSLRGITEVFDVVTGEVHEDATAYFSNHPLLIHPKDPVDYALRVCRHEVNVLITVGAADGRFDPDEQDRVLLHVFDRLPDLVMDEDLMRERLCRLAPDVGAFEAAMLQMSRFRRGDPVALLRSLRKLVDADGRITREEAIFAEEVQAQLRAMTS
jgi:hypothetical protein